MKMTMGKIPQKGDKAKAKKAPKELALTEKSGTIAVKGKKEVEKKKVLDKVNLDIAAKKPVDRELKYKYPENISSAKEKKEFRRKMRSDRKALDSKITRLGKSDKPEDKKALKDAQAELKKLQENYFNAEA